MSSSSGRWLSVPAAALAGDRAVVQAAGREILLLRAGGTVHAFDNACPHRGNPLVDGEVLGDVLECAYHGWRFDLESGACLAGDGAARRYEAEERDGVIRVLLDQD
ncbi:MAG TPA: Rieske (2Fe-2S) protein [Gaiellaceae bacterium]|nr:Rieske (2Fe-2S) protein [Gaiellaceae bacterium]